MNPAEVAEQIVAARKRGDTKPVLNGVEFNTEERGWCSRFVRLCHRATGLDTALFGCCANTTGDHLKAHGKQVTQLDRGNIVVFTSKAWKDKKGRWHGRCSTCGQAVYHIGIYLGEGRIAENTSSGTRGAPRKAGTKISTLAQIGESRVWGYFSLQPAVESGLKVVLLPGSQVIPCRPHEENGVTRADVRPLAEALGYEVYDHIADQRKVYLRCS